MARIFLALALFAIALLTANLILGFVAGDVNGTSRRYREALKQLDALAGGPAGVEGPEYQAKKAELREFVAREFQPIRRRQSLHLLTGVLAALVTVLVNCISVTYLIGTSRWCREVVDTYGLDPALAERSNQLKRKTFPWALGAFAIILGVVTMGACADPGANSPNSAAWVAPHFIGALLGTLLIGWSYWVQVVNVGANYEIIDEIVHEVQRIRRQRGLDPD